MQKIFKLKKTYLGIILSAAIIFVVLLNLNQTYISETEILIIPKSKKATISVDQIIENLNTIPFSLSFYDKVNSKIEISENSIANLPAYKKKNYWNSKLEIERIKKSSILKISTKDSSLYKAQTLNDEVILTLISSVGSFYDIENDIDLRIIDKLITKASTKSSLWILILESFILGFILTIILSYFDYYIFKKKKEIEKQEFNFFNFKNNSSKPKKTLEDLDEIILQAEEKPMDFSQKPEVSFEKKSAAPSNLPVAPDNLPIDPKEEIKEEKSTKLKEKIEPIIREATPEEVKERLNKLLSGEEI